MHELKLLETYKGCNIWSNEGAICVNRVEDGTDYLFYIALDDSKADDENRKWIAEANNTADAKKYIDWLKNK